MSEAELAAEQKIRADIERYGWSLMGVLPDEDHPRGWAYSIGATTTFEHPEVSVFGLGEPALELLNQVIASLRVQPLQTGVEYTDFFDDGRPCIFQEVKDEWIPYFFGIAYDFYPDRQTRVLQLYWSDDNGKYPWDESFDSELRGFQPSLHLAA